jgi:hypothetical protein
VLDELEALWKRDKDHRREIARQLTEDAEAWGLYDSPTGTEAQPNRYTRPDGRETIDAIRDRLGDAGFISFCIGNAMKYEDRTGKKGDAEEDRKKAAFYWDMATHVEGKGRDPRSQRPGFVPYVRVGGGV